MTNVTEKIKHRFEKETEFYFGENTPTLNVSSFKQAKKVLDTYLLLSIESLLKEMNTKIKDKE